jgi:hypothetical protein
MKKLNCGNTSLSDNTILLGIFKKCNFVTPICGDILYTKYTTPQMDRVSIACCNAVSYFTIPIRTASTV